MLRVIRAGKHTQASLARELGIAPANVYMWKDRGIPRHWLPRIATALGIDITELCARLRTP